MASELNNGAIFLHVPKTGGVWVERVLEEQGLIARRLAGGRHIDMTRVLYHDQMYSVKRMLARRVRARLGRAADPPVAGAYRFCFVRHPIKWYESFWRYMVALRWRHWGDRDALADWHPCMGLNGLGSDDFNTFMRNVVRERPGFVGELYGWYTQNGIAFVGRQEELCEGLIHVLRELRLPFDEDRVRNFPRTNESKAPGARIEWDAGLRAEVERLEYAALVRYGYADSPIAAADTGPRSNLTAGRA